MAEVRGFRGIFEENTFTGAQDDVDDAQRQRVNFFQRARRRRGRRRAVDIPLRFDVPAAIFPGEHQDATGGAGIFQGNSQQGIEEAFLDDFPGQHAGRFHDAGHIE